MRKLVLLIIAALFVISNANANDPDFDCRTLGITLYHCYNDNGILKAEFSVKGTKEPASYDKVIDIIKGIDYTLEATEKYESANGDFGVRTGLPKDYKITNIGGDRYKLEANMGSNIVKNMRVAYTKDDLYEYTFEIDYCYLKANNFDIDMYGYEKCEVTQATQASKEPVAENKVTSKAVAPVQKEESSNLPYIIGGSVLFAIIVAGVFIFKRKSAKNQS